MRATSHSSGRCDHVRANSSTLSRTRLSSQAGTRPMGAAGRSASAARLMARRTDCQRSRSTSQRATPGLVTMAPPCALRRPARASVETPGSSAVVRVDHVSWKSVRPAAESSPVSGVVALIRRSCRMSGLGRATSAVALGVVTVFAYCHRVETTEQAYRYLGASRVGVLDGAPDLRLATSGGVTSDGPAAHPRFFEGFL